MTTALGFKTNANVLNSESVGGLPGVLRDFNVPVWLFVDRILFRLTQLLSVHSSAEVSSVRNRHIET